MLLLNQEQRMRYHTLAGGVPQLSHLVEQAGPAQQHMNLSRDASLQCAKETQVPAIFKRSEQ
jgi:hypothetical protein